MQSHGGADSGEQMDLAGVAELFFGRGGSCRLDKFAEARSRIREAPGRQFDAERLQRIENPLSLVCFHGSLSLGSKLQSLRFSRSRNAARRLQFTMQKHSLTLRRAAKNYSGVRIYRRVGGVRLTPALFK